MAKKYWAHSQDRLILRVGSYSGVDSYSGVGSYLGWAHTQGGLILRVGGACRQALLEEDEDNVISTSPPQEHPRVNHPTTHITCQGFKTPLNIKHVKH